MTSRLKDILEQAKVLASAKSVRNASDEDFMARVDAVCLIRRIYDGLYLDNSEMVNKMKRLYPEFARRIDSRQDKQEAQPLVRAFHRFVYGTSFISHSIGVEKWEEEVVRYEALYGIDPDNEFSFNPQETTELSLTELKRRCADSRSMYVRYLSELTKKEFIRLSEVADERLLRNQFRGIEEEIIPDILPIKITSNMSVPTLMALDAIFTLRSWLSNESHDINDPAYANLQVRRTLQTSKALKTKYRKTKTLNDKIEILSLIDGLEENLSCNHSEFAIEEASKLERKYSADLTAFQSLRLQLISDIEELDCEDTASGLLPLAGTAFEIGALTLIEHRVSREIREAIFERFTSLLKSSIGANDIEEAASLLTLFPFWNSDTEKRKKLKQLTSDFITQTSDLNLTLPVRRLNSIAAEIYTRLDIIAGKYDDYSGVPA